MTSTDTRKPLGIGCRIRLLSDKKDVMVMGKWDKLKKGDEGTVTHITNVPRGSNQRKIDVTWDRFFAAPLTDVEDDFEYCWPYERTSLEE